MRCAALILIVTMDKFAAFLLAVVPLLLGACTTMSAEEYAAQFHTKPPTRLAAERTLIHLGLPGPHDLVIWYGRRPGSRAPETVGITVREGDRVVTKPSVIHQPLPPAGRIRVGGLSPGTTYELTVQIDEELSQTLVAKTAPPSSAAEAFSFLAYSCFAPFAYKGDAVIKQRTVHVLRMLGARAPTGHDEDDQRPSFVLGTGDQVYVDDGAYHGPRLLFGSNPRAMLVGKHSETPRYSGDPEGPDTFFSILYRAYFGLDLLDEALRALPSAMMWDDHDIRDGWGSQRDEENRGGNAWRAHLNAARRHFIAYQMLRNPAPIRFPEFDTATGADWTGLADRLLGAGQKPTERPELHFTFDWGASTRFFVMDLRSRRGGASDRRWAMSDGQLNDLAGWLDADASARPRLYVLVSSLPLTHAPGNLDSVEWKPSLRQDERLDNWWSKELQGQRDRVLRLLLEHFRARKQDRLLILSGDVHFAEVLTLQLIERGRRRIFGHEVISSGLAQSEFHSVDKIFRDFRHRRKPQGETRFLDGRLISTGAGARLFVPHFAEVFVDGRDQGGAPRVELLYYPAADKEGEDGQLVNPLSTLHWLVNARSSDAKGRLTLPLDGPPIFDNKLFDRFMIRGNDALGWFEDAKDWKGYE